MGLLEWLPMEGVHPGTEGATEKEAPISDYKLFLNLLNLQLTQTVHILGRLQAA